MGKTALAIAWAMHDLKTVRVLVQSGAALSPGLWIEALSSPNLCHTLASGLGEWRRSRQEAAKISEDAARVLATVTIPPEAVLQWMVQAPLAASVLMSDVLLQRCDDAPSRADLNKKDMVVEYSHSTLFDQNLPEFVRLCPPDRGLATPIVVDFLEVQDPLRFEFIYAISKSKSTQIYASLGIHGTVRLGWQVIREAFIRDVAIEFALLVTMLFWVIYLDARNRTTFYFRWLSWSLLLIITRREVFSFVIFLLYQSETGDTLLCTSRGQNQAKFRRQWPQRIHKHVRLFDVINLSSSIVLLMNAGVVTYEEEQSNLIPEYLIFLSFTASIRWLRLLQFVCSFRQIGPAVLPIVKSITAITSFLFVFFTTLLSFVHANYWFNYNQRTLFPEIFSFFVRQFFLGMVSRWPVFMELLCSPHHQDYYQKRWARAGAGKTEEFTSALKDLKTANDAQNRLCQNPIDFYTWQLFWYLCMAFTVAIVLLQVFVGVLSAAYREQLAQSYISFNQFLAHTVAYQIITRSLYIETDSEIAARRLRWKKLPWRKALQVRLVFVLKRALDQFQKLTGMITSPARGQYVWICTPVDQLSNTGGSNQEEANWSKLLDNKVNLVRDACKGERDSYTRLSDTLQRAESRIDHLYQESIGMDASEFCEQLRFNRKMTEFTQKRNEEQSEARAGDGERAPLRKSRAMTGRFARGRGSVIDTGGGLPGGVAALASLKRRPSMIVDSDSD